MSQLIGWPHLTMTIVLWLAAGQLHTRATQPSDIHRKDHRQITQLPDPARDLSEWRFEAGIAAPTIPIDDRPLLPQQEYDREQAGKLLADMAAGRLRLTVPEREAAQLRTLAIDGCLSWPAPPPGVTILNDRQTAILAETAELPVANSHPRVQRSPLAARSGSESERKNASHSNSGVVTFNPLRRPPAPALLHMLAVLVSKSTQDRPLELMSLLRPPYRLGDYVHVGPLNPHSLGLAADIASFGGYDIRQDQPESCVKATLALLDALPPGCYRLGLPKAPETPLFVGRPPLPPILSGWLPPAPAAKSVSSADCVMGALLGVTLGQSQPRPWPFFPPPQPRLEHGRICPEPTANQPIIGNQPVTTPEIISYRNEAYAPIDKLLDRRLQREIAAARLRGVEIVAVFPDGADHIHIDVRKHP